MTKWVSIKLYILYQRKCKWQIYIRIIIYKLTIEDIYDRLNSNSHLYRQYIIRVKYSTQMVYYINNTLS